MENTSLEKQIETGYMTEKYVIDLAVKTGFKFLDKSEVNANSLMTETTRMVLVVTKFERFRK